MLECNWRGETRARRVGKRYQQIFITLSAEVKEARA
jgi:hypothetical protein